MSFKFKVLLIIVGMFAGFFVNAEVFNFSRNLKLGDRGLDVKQLQIFLNSDPDTRVAVSGVGSLNNETEYFGLLTQKAVMKFQNKYKSEILTPINLVSPTGFVGPLTRIKINLLLQKNNQSNHDDSQQNENSVSQTPNTAVTELKDKTLGETQPKLQGVPMNIKPIGNNISKPLNLFGAGYDNGYQTKTENMPPLNSQTPISQTGSTPQNNNLENFDQIKDLVLKVGREQGYSEAYLDKAISVLRQNAAATTTDFLKEFEKEMRASGSVVMERKTNLFSSLLKQLGNTLAKVFAPQANASYGRPFGAMVLTPIICTCSGNWLVTMMPLSKGGPALLTHYPGAQMYLNHNFPFSRYVLGFYVPQGAPCMMIAFPSCITIPSQGMTTPRIGS